MQENKVAEQELFTLRQASEILNIPYRKLLKEVQLGRYPAAKRGWVWLMTKGDIERVRELQRR